MYLFVHTRNATKSQQVKLQTALHYTAQYMYNVQLYIVQYTIQCTCIAPRWLPRAAERSILMRLKSQFKVHCSNFPFSINYLSWGLLLH